MITKLNALGQPDDSYGAEPLVSRYNGKFLTHHQGMM